MLKVKSLKLIFLALIALSVLFPFVVQSSIENDKVDKQSDLLTIQLETGLAKDEMPAVVFAHDLHTKAVNGDCAACHVEKEDAFSFSFKRTDEPASMELYHDGCITCHDEKKAEKKETGPLAAECRVCHVEKSTKISSRKPIEFDRSLHYIHEKAEAIKSMDKTDQKNCSACHHKYHEKTKETFIAKGEEESCSYCHKAEKKNDIRAIRQASHDSCVKCHETLQGKEVLAGPISCEGCHDAQKQKEIKQVKDVPRLERNQPDVVAVTGWKEGSKESKSYMAGVAFNHKAHEMAGQSCKSCHHQTLKKCKDCHGADGGGMKGGFISLGQAMHDKNSSQSCVGCHKKETQKTDCAGCHAMMTSDKKENPESCKKCHSLNSDQLNGSDDTGVVKSAISSRKSGYKIVPSDKIPEVVEIGILANEYKPSQFPHKKVMDAIAARVEKNQMANAFHQDQAGLCMGCHHNSPKTLEPVKCASCHSKNSSGADGMPGLKGAYHGQCITCHTQMNVTTVAATDCVKCHEAKK